MKGFFLFLLFSFALIGTYITYKIYNPDNTQLIKDGLNWVAVDRNVTE